MMKRNDPIRRDTWCEIDLDCIVANFKASRGILGKNTKIAAVLKADAYGHGAVAVARELVRSGADVDMLAVACLPEALELRSRFDDIDILIMGYTPEAYLKEAVNERITLTTISLGQARFISELATQLRMTAKLHIKIDTGFNRLGMKPGPELLQDIEEICRLQNIEVEGIFTHLALVDAKSDQKQLDAFMGILSSLERDGVHIPIRHVCDSISAVRYPEYQLDMVRLGAMLYGVYPLGDNKLTINTCMPMAFKTRIAQIKEIEDGEGVGYDSTYIAKGRRRIGTLPVGYADGYMRHLSNNAQVSVRGRRAPVVGKICMDQCMIDLTELKEVEVGDEVLLFGGNGPDSIPILEIAEWAGTNRNEILSLISRRVPRVYLKEQKIVEVIDYITYETENR